MYKDISFCFVTISIEEIQTWPFFFLQQEGYNCSCLAAEIHSMPWRLCLNPNYDFGFTATI